MRTQDPERAHPGKVRSSRPAANVIPLPRRGSIHLKWGRCEEDQVHQAQDIALPRRGGDLSEAIPFAWTRLPAGVPARASLSRTSHGPGMLSLVARLIPHHLVDACGARLLLPQEIRISYESFGLPL